MLPPETTSPAAEDFFSRALARIRKFLLILAAGGIALCLVLFHWPVTVGFLAGAVISYLNQTWLEQAVEAMGERITAQQSPERGGIIVVRAVLRYVLIAGGAYVIFNVSVAALYGFLGGVFLPIAAVACEVTLELFTVLRRRF